MRLATIYAQMESELKWRQDEIRFFQNLYQRNLSDESQLDQSRRTLILLLYAHFEGFIKFALALYVDSVNSVGIVCGKADSALVAATLSHVFKDLRNPDKKSDAFRNVLPDDTQLHKFAREREFVERTNDIKNIRLTIPNDIVDTESNLKPVVLRKNLFKLGFDYSGIVSFEGNIHKLLNYRNDVAHGSRRDGITRREYEEISDATYRVMYFVRDLVTKSLREKKFKKSST